MGWKSCEKIEIKNITISLKMKCKHNIRSIAFYLPQYYPTPENDAWWGEGFTEWTNVARSKPLFDGHYQPRVPSSLGFYDLRLPEVREKQARLASDAGIEGFCYWHYWFNGKRMLDLVFNEVVKQGKPDFPFCLCWANHSWYAKSWDPTKDDRMLIEQTYPGEQDYINHFNALLPAFQDERYMKYDGKLIFGVFAPMDLPDTRLFMDTWNKLAKENGLEGFYFFAFARGSMALKYFDDKLYDTVVLDVKNDIWDNIGNSWWNRKKWGWYINHIHKPYPVQYKEYVDLAIKTYSKHPEYTPCINPDFDHSPRSGHRGHVFRNSTPELWRDLCKGTIANILANEHDLFFIKAWNEWGEGNYLEPDLKWGGRYLDALRESISYEP